MNGRIYVEDWAVSYGSPYLLDAESPDEPAGILVEDGDELRFHGGSSIDDTTALAFVDGVRRAEAWLYRVASDGETARGLAGTYGVGTVEFRSGEAPAFASERIRRVAIWGSGAVGSLDAITGGWRWEGVSIPATEPEAPLARLQTSMREAEQELASELTARGFLVVLDGPLNFVVGSSAGAGGAGACVGYVKSHHRAFLPPAQHARVAELGLAERTSLFATGERYACYARIAAPGPHAGPWSGIIRLHLPGHAGLNAARQLADALTARLPAYAGVAHRDPRAPQNLQPIGALETHLRHLMGDASLAARAVRDAAYEGRT